MGPVYRCYLIELSTYDDSVLESFTRSACFRLTLLAANAAFQYSIVCSSCIFGKSYLMK